MNQVMAVFHKESGGEFVDQGEFVVQFLTSLFAVAAIQLCIVVMIVHTHLLIITGCRINLRKALPALETLTIALCVKLTTLRVCTTLAKKKKKTATTIMHKIRTLFLSRNITRLAQWRGLPRLRASLHWSAIKLDFSISHDRNSVLILCIIVVAVFFFGQEVLPWPKKLRQARKPHIGACMLDRSRHVRAVVSIFLARVVNMCV